MLETLLILAQSPGPVPPGQPTTAAQWIAYNMPSILTGLATALPAVGAFIVALRNNARGKINSDKLDVAAVALQANTNITRDNGDTLAAANADLHKKLDAALAQIADLKSAAARSSPN